MSIFQLPEISEHFDFPAAANSNPAFWRLSSDMYPMETRGGLSAHADWMNGWEPIIMQTIVTQCLQGGFDCGVGLISDNRSLY